MAGRKKRPKITEEQKKKLAKAMQGNKNAVGADSGRPSSYNKSICRRVYRLHLMQLTVERICEAVEIDTATYYRWKKDIPEFRSAIERGVYGMDEEVTAALKLKATGYSRKVVKPIKIKNKIGEDEIVNHVYKEYFPPDTRAIEISLKNRANTKGQWSNLPDPDEPPPAPTIQLNNIDLSKLDDTTINKLLKALKPGPTEG